MVSSLQADKKHFTGGFSVNKKIISLIAAASIAVCAVSMVTAADEEKETLWADNFDSCKNEVEYYHEKKLDYNNKVLADGTLNQAVYEGIKGVTLYTTARNGGDDSSYWQATKDAKDKTAVTTQVSRFSTSSRGAKIEFAEEYVPTEDKAVVLQFDVYVSNAGETTYDEAIELNGENENEIDFIDGLKLPAEKWATVKININTWGTSVFAGDSTEPALTLPAKSLKSINLNGMTDGVPAGDAIKAESNPFGYPQISFDNMEIYNTAALEAPEGTEPEPTVEPTEEPSAEPTAAPEEAKTIKLVIGSSIITTNNVEAALDVPAQIIGERTMVPLRAIFEALGASVEWDDATKTVTSVKGETTVKLTIGDNAIYKNGEAKELDVPAQIVDDRTLVPVRAIAESFDANVGWDGPTQTVTIEAE